MLRLLFEKKGNAVYISHLDLMRLFQRAFKRAGLQLTHTHGFNPRPSVSIALPLSVCVESRCELLDFELDGQSISCEEICSRLNGALIDGVRVLQVYEQGRKIKELRYLDCVVTLEYDRALESDAAEKIAALFREPTLIVEKKGKNGLSEQDIIPLIRRISAVREGQCIRLCARVCCQEPSLNPMLLASAVQRYLPALQADHARCERLEIYDAEEQIFR